MHCAHVPELPAVRLVQLMQLQNRRAKVSMDKGSLRTCTTLLFVYQRDPFLLHQRDLFLLQTTELLEHSCIASKQARAPFACSALL